MNAKNEKRIRKVADAVRNAAAEGAGRGNGRLFTCRLRFPFCVAFPHGVGHPDASLRH